LLRYRLQKSQARVMFPNLPYLWTSNCCVERKKKDTWSCYGHLANITNKL